MEKPNKNLPKKSSGENFEYKKLSDIELSSKELDEIKGTLLEILEKPHQPLGEGATAEVYTVANKPYCFKEITKDSIKLFKMEDIATNSIEVELEIQMKATEAGVRSPVPYFDIQDKVNNRRIIVMERIFGNTFQEIIDGKEELPENFNFKAFSEKLKKMVDLLHEHNIHHCDLFPRNIMTDKDGSPVIIDYGISRIVKSNENPYIVINKFGEKIERHRDVSTLDYSLIEIEKFVDKMTNRK